jgi:hypothetical protein
MGDFWDSIGNVIEKNTYLKKKKKKRILPLSPGSAFPFLPAT